MNDNNNTAAPQNNKNGDVSNDATTQIEQPMEVQLTEVIDFIGWRPSQALEQTGESDNSQ